MTSTRRSKPLGHPPLPFLHPIYVTLLVCLLLALAAVPTNGVPGDRNRASDQKKPVDDFLIFGTVFDQQGFVVQGAKIEVRRAGEKKVRWRAMSDRRGEFGVRVPVAGDYTLSIDARGFEKLEKKVTAGPAQRVDVVERLKREVKSPKK